MPPVGGTLGPPWEATAAADGAALADNEATGYATEAPISTCGDSMFMRACWQTFPRAVGSAFGRCAVDSDHDYDRLRGDRPDCRDLERRRHTE